MGAVSDIGNGGRTLNLSGQHRPRFARRLTAGSCARSPA